MFSCSVLAIERAGVVDSGSEEEEDEDDLETAAVPGRDGDHTTFQSPAKPGTGFCNCSLM